MTDLAFQRCINPDCAAVFDLHQVLPRCPKCAALLDVDYDWDRLSPPRSLAEFDAVWAKAPVDPLARSGVWRFRRLLPFAEPGTEQTIGEGMTQLRTAPAVAAYTGLKPESLFLQYEGLNPSGSFKDNGMAGAFTHARMVGAKTAACASTGNTSASLACFAAATGLMKAVVFVGSGKIALGKLAQALDYGCKTLAIRGDFDDAMARVQEVCAKRGIYLVNSLNPFRLEGQKTIMYRILEGLRWEVPDWIICPGGNLGNSSAFGKAFIELARLGLIKRVPRLAVINASGAATLSKLVNEHGLKWNNGRVDSAKCKKYYKEMDVSGARAKTLASAIEINRPVNLDKCLRAIDFMNGVVRHVSDEDILDAKAVVGRAGFGCEPASAASVAGARLLVREGVIDKGARVACVLTGHALKAPGTTVDYHSKEGAAFVAAFKEFGAKKNPFRNPPVEVENDLGAILKVMEADA
jgi:threonine synthase